MQIDRMFVPEGRDPFSMFEYEKWDCCLKNYATGAVIYEQKGVEVPKHWSEKARTVLVTKYFRKGGVPQSVLPAQDGMPNWLSRSEATIGCTYGGENSVKQVIRRIVGHWTYTGMADGYFNPSDAQLARIRLTEGTTIDSEINKITERNARAFFDENVFIMMSQMAAPNSPQWFNTGLYWAYGIQGTAQGHYYVNLPSNTKNYSVYDDKDIVKHNEKLSSFATASQTSYKRVQAHACFILTLNDNMTQDDGILSWYTTEGRIFKFGSGSGVNISKLRAKDEPLSGGGKSSGAMSWVEVSDRNAGSIKSGGVTRRAAKMLVMDIDHPDVMEFIECKAKAEVAAASLITGSGIITTACSNIMKQTAFLLGDKVNLQNTSIDEEFNRLVHHDGLKGMIRDAIDAGVSANYIDRAIRLAIMGEKEWIDEPYTNHFEGRAYQLVPFQNGNNSVRVTSEFYKLVDDNKEWSTTWRTNKNHVAWKRPAKEIEYAIAKACWMSGDPGMQYDTTVNDWNVTPNDGRIDASNPCSEHMRLSDSACNLASINLMKFVSMVVGPTKRAHIHFNVPGYLHAVKLWTMILDITNAMAHLPSKTSAISTYNYRDIGLGYANLGAVLMSFGLPYDSDAARSMAGAITALMHAQAHVTSGEMAGELGAYPRFYVNRDAHMRVVKNHMAIIEGRPCDGVTVQPPSFDWAALGDAVPHQKQEFADTINSLWMKALGYGLSSGYRNAEITLLAPTGTISILMDCETTGVEPMLGLSVKKDLVGGGEFKFTPSECIKYGLVTHGYTENQINEIAKYINEHRDVPGDGSVLQKAHIAVFDTSFPSIENKRFLSWESHINMMASVQPFLSGAISKTINMPMQATIDDIRKAFRMGHDKALKAVAIYRDGSKLSQPLTIPGVTDTASVADSTTPTSENVTVTQMTTLPVETVKPQGLSPDVPPGGRMRLSYVRTPGIDICVSLGIGHLYLHTVRYPDGKCAEIWATYTADQGIIQAMLSTICRTANVALQWGVPLEDYINCWADCTFEPFGLVGNHEYIKTAKSVVNLMARLLNYHELGNTNMLDVMPDSKIPQDEVQKTVKAISASPTVVQQKMLLTGERCPQCASMQYVTTGTACKKCMNCGFSGGCG